MLQPLPGELGPRFRVADALAAGVSAGRLRRADVESPFHGVRVVESAASGAELNRRGEAIGAIEHDHLQRARAYAVRMGDDEFFTHVTAAVIWGLPLPIGRIQGAPVDVGVLPPRRLHRAQGVKGHEAARALTAVSVDPHTELRVSTPATTWAMLGSVLRDVRDLVAVGDAVVRQWRVDKPLATIDELGLAVGSGRRIGIQRLRDALPLVRTQSASRPESWLRVILTDAGLPEPELNFDVVEDVVELACVDLAYPAWKVAIEYEGEHHLVDPVQWARDIRRYERLAAAGWRVVRITKDEVFKTPELAVARVRQAIHEYGRG